MTRPAVDWVLGALGPGVPAGYRETAAVALGADRLATPFLTGYRAAVRALVPAVGPSSRPALAATEEGPLHPARIATSARRDGAGWRLTGRKRFVTGADADTFAVLASEGSTEGRSALGVWVVPASAGVSVTEMPNLPFVPEVGHAEIELRDVFVPEGSRVDGDGWADLVRPFRTVEDIYVLGAAATYLAGAGCRGAWPIATVTSLVGVTASLGALAGADPGAPGVHVALDAAIAAFRSVVDALPWGDPGEGSDEAVRWRRDRPLLDVAGRARRARTEGVWSRLRTG